MIGTATVFCQKYLQTVLWDFLHLYNYVTLAPCEAMVGSSKERTNPGALLTLFVVQSNPWIFKNISHLTLLATWAMLLSK